MILNPPVYEPLNLVLMITDECNMPSQGKRCRHCMVRSKSESTGKKLSRETIRHWTREARRYGLSQFTIYGGEPFLTYKEGLLTYALKEGLQNQFYPQLNTNGVIGDPQNSLGIDCKEALDRLDHLAKSENRLIYLRNSLDSHHLTPLIGHVNLYKNFIRGNYQNLGLCFTTFSDSESKKLVEEFYRECKANGISKEPVFSVGDGFILAGEAENNKHFPGAIPPATELKLIGPDLIITPYGAFMWASQIDKRINLVSYEGKNISELIRDMNQTNLVKEAQAKYFASKNVSPYALRPKQTSHRR